MRIIGNDLSVPRQTQKVASGTLPNGKAVVVNADGTVSVASGPSFGSEVAWDEPTGGNVTYILSVFDSNSNKVVLAYRDGEDSNKGKALVGTVSGTSISFGSIVTCVDETFQPWGGISFDSSNNKVVISYAGGAYAYGKSVVGTVSGTSISFGTPVVWYSGNANYVSSCFDSTANKIVISYQDAGSSDYGKAVVGTVSGTSISFGSIATFRSGSTRSTWCDYDPDNDKTLIVYRNLSNNDIECVVSTVSGTSISFGSAVQIESGYGYTPVTVYDTTNNKFIVAYGRPSDTDAKILVGTVSGTSISFGSATTFLDNFAEYISLVHDPDSNKIIIGYKDDGTSKNAEVKIGTVSGTSISVGNATVANSGTSRYVTLAYDTLNNKTVFTYQKDRTGSTDSGNSKVFSTGDAPLTSENYIGMSSGAVIDNSVSKSVGTAVEFADTNVSNNMFDVAYDSNAGKIVIVYADEGDSEKGKAVVGTVSGTSISFGSPVTYESGGAASYNHVAYDSNAQKLLIIYSDYANSSKGTAVVGTVSGTSISFGSPAIFETSTAGRMDLVYDSNAQKFLIAYQATGDSNQGKCLVATISGTSVSFGATHAFDTNAINWLALAFDSTNNKVLVVYDQTTNSRLDSEVLTISGTSVSSGGVVNITSNQGQQVGAAYDVNAQKILVTFKDAGDSNYGKAVVGTISGTSVSYGTIAQFNNGNNDVQFTSANYHSAAKQVIITYRDSSDSNQATLVPATISGTDVTFGDEIKVEPGSDRENAPRSTYDSTSESIVTIFRAQDGGGDDGFAVVTKTPYTDITRGQVADGGHALIDTQGAISDNQIGLTAGQSYYVQADGTLSTTAGDPSVFAGTAVSATKLIVKG